MKWGCWLLAAGAGERRPGLSSSFHSAQDSPPQRTIRRRWRNRDLVQALQFTQRETEAQGGYAFPKGIKSCISYWAHSKILIFQFFLDASLRSHFNVPVITCLAIINPLFASVSPYVKRGTGWSLSNFCLGLTPSRQMSPGFCVPAPHPSWAAKVQWLFSSLSSSHRPNLHSYQGVAALC